MPTRPRTHEQRIRDAQPHRELAHSAEDAARRHADQLGALIERLRHGARWVWLRQVHLQERPWCVLCAAAGRTAAAVVLDHVVPARIVVQRCGEEAFYDRGNLQGLCQACDVSKTAAERLRGHAGPTGSAP